MSVPAPRSCRHWSATTTISPTADIATTNAPFILSATAITDASSSLTTINNAGNITASVSIVTPALDAVVVTSVRAIDLTASLANGITINNSGQILGDVIYGSGGNNFVLNVGNIGSRRHRQQRRPASQLAQRLRGGGRDQQQSQVGSAPSTTTSIIDFGAGTGDVLHVGAFGYVNSVIKSNPGALAVTVDTNGTLYVANTGGTGNTSTGSLNARTFDVNGGTLGLTISQGSSGLTPVIKRDQRGHHRGHRQSGAGLWRFCLLRDHCGDGGQSHGAEHLVLIDAPTINISATTLTQNNRSLSQNLPFLFQDNATPLSLQGTAGVDQTLVICG